MHKFNVMDCDADTTNNTATFKKQRTFISTVAHIFPPPTPLTDMKLYLTGLLIVNCRWCNVACHYSVERSAVVVKVYDCTFCVKSSVHKLKPPLSKSHSWTTSVHSWSGFNAYCILLTWRVYHSFLLWCHVLLSGLMRTLWDVQLQFCKEDN